MRQLFNHQTNYILTFNSATIDHYLAKELFEGVEEYSHACGKISNKFSTFGIQLAKDLKQLVKKLVPNQFVMINSIGGIHSSAGKKLANKIKVLYGSAYKFGAPVVLWCTPEGKMNSENAPIKKYNIHGYPTTDYFWEKEREAVFLTTLPLFSSYLIGERALIKDIYKGIYKLMYKYFLANQIMTLILYLVLKYDENHYISKLKGINLNALHDKYALFVDWDMHSNPQEILYFYHGMRLKGALYKPYRYFRFSGRYFLDMFKEKRKRFQDSLQEELFVKND